MGLLEIAPFIAGKGVAGAGGESLGLASGLFSLVGSLISEVLIGVPEFINF